MKQIEYLLRLGVFLTFFGHGIFALQGKEVWLPYLTVFGISDMIAYKVMFLIGIIDVIVAVSILVKPLSPIILWAVFWAFSAALMRPVVGQPIWDFVERGSNWIVPLALFVIIHLNKSNLNQELN